MPRTHGEALQIIEFKTRGLHKPHHDSSDNYASENARRLCTVIFYLTGDGSKQRGGATVFPALWTRNATDDKGKYCNEASPALKVYPVRGDALLLYNHDITGTLEHDLFYGDCLHNGRQSKVVVKRWIRMEPYHDDGWGKTREL